MKFPAFVIGGLLLAVASSGGAQAAVGSPLSQLNVATGERQVVNPSQQFAQRRGGAVRARPALGGRRPALGGGRPAFRPSRPTFRPGSAGVRPGVRPNRPASRPNRPGFRPNRPGLGANRPGYRPNRPAFRPNRPGNRPIVRPWRARPYYGRIVAGVVLGTVIAVAAAGIPPAPPSADLCWYWSNSKQTRGYWDYCQ